MSFACTASAIREDMDFESLEIAVGLLDRGRADIFSRCNVRKLGGCHAANPDIVRQIDQDLTGGYQYFERLLFDCGDLPPDRHRFALRRLRLGEVELKGDNKQGQNQKR